MRGENVMVEENFGRSREGGFRGGRIPPKPVKIGEEYEVDVKETSQRGDGIARIEGLVVFVPHAKPGDHVRIRITRISRKFAEADLVEKEEKEKEGPM
jgi:predicted RNA-binding protein with TRAM domain